MTDSPHIVQLDEANFMQVVVEGSDQCPVLVDFWADWCGPCKALVPILEKLAIEFDGAFVLAKLDTEAHPGIAQQLGIRSLPTVKLFRNRELVDEFTGALPEDQVRQFLTPHLGEPPVTEPEASPTDNLLTSAMALFDQGHSEQARELLQQAQAAEPENTDVLLALGQVCVSLGDLDTARSCLSALPEEAREATSGRRLAATLDLAAEADTSVSAAALGEQLAADESSSELRYRYAIASALTGDVQKGMDELLYLVRTDPEHAEGAPRQKLLSLFDMLGEDPLAGQYRRKLFTLLH